MLATLVLFGAGWGPHGLAMIGAASAQTPPSSPQQKPGTTTDDMTRTAEDLARSAGDAAKAVGSAIGSLWNDMTGKIAPGSPTDYLPGQINEEDKRFFAILETIGLRLREVTVSKGLIPSANYRFVAEREPTDTDIAKAEDLLRRYREVADGIWSRAKQRIARSTLDTVSTAGTTLTAMDVTLSPWPDASYQIATKPAAGNPPLEQPPAEGKTAPKP